MLMLHQTGRRAEPPFADAAALQPRGEGTSDDFLSWFNYQRLFQINTWGHLALVAAFVAFQLVPYLVSTAFKIMRAVSGVGSRPASNPDGAAEKTFQDALKDGDIAVRTCIDLMHAQFMHIVVHQYSVYNYMLRLSLRPSTHTAGEPAGVETATALVSYVLQARALQMANQPLPSSCATCAALGVSGYSHRSCLVCK